MSERLVAFHFAMPSESAAGLGDSLDLRSPPGWRAVSAPPATDASDLEGRFLSVISGVGKVNAAASLAHLATRHRLAAVVNLGYCASLTRDFPVGSIVAPARTLQHDYGHFEGGRLIPVRAGFETIRGREEAAERRYFELSRSLSERLRALSPEIGGANTILATGDIFVVDAERAASIREATGAAFLDMEAAALAQLGDRLGIPVVSLKVVSDLACDGAVDEYSSSIGDLRDRLAAAIVAAREVARELLAGDLPP